MKQLFLIVCLALATQVCHAAPAAAPAEKELAPLADNFSGKATEILHTAGYTYVLLDNGKQKVWIAAEQFGVNKGDTVAVHGGMPMPNYHSKTLKRDFDVVYFTGKVEVNGNGVAGKTAELPPNHPPIAAGTPAKGAAAGCCAKDGKIDCSAIKKVAGGQTISEIHAGKTKLSGKSIAVRGKVTKYNPEILGKNWLHIQDASGADKDLVITTKSAVKLGDTVRIDGKLSTDRDFGAGYKFSVIVEDAKVTVE